MKKKHTSRILLRVFLLVLILLNMTAIFLLSSQNAEKSTQTADKLENVVLDTFLPDADENPTDFTASVKENLTVFLRKSAHLVEYLTLGALILLFLLTWQRPPLLLGAAAFGATVLYAISDEVHQYFIDGRTASATDVLIDAIGALVGILSVLLIRYLLQRKKRKPLKIKRTTYALSLPAPAPLRIALASDLHGMGFSEALEEIRALSPDLILLPGDLTDDEGLSDPADPAYAFLRACASIAPTYYSLGNHEIACYHRGNPFRHPTPILPSDAVIARIRDCGVTLLDNEAVAHRGFTVCGLRSGINKKENHPDREALASFADMEGFRILLCHHPEYYVPYVKETGIDLTVCGHAHGGQWRILGHGIYAPGQGLFPKYTAGVLDGKCVISRGIGNHAFVPRIFNSPEVILLEISPTNPF